MAGKTLAHYIGDGVATRGYYTHSESNQVYAVLEIDKKRNEMLVDIGGSDRLFSLSLRLHDRRVRLDSKRKLRQTS